MFQRVCKFECALLCPALHRRVAHAALEHSHNKKVVTSSLGDLWCSDDGELRKLDYFLSTRKTTRSASSWMLPAPTPDFCPRRCVELVSGEGLSQFELDISDGEGSVPVCGGISDVHDAFHFVWMPMWLSRYFGMPAGRAGNVGEEFAGGQALNPDDMLIPLPRCLPMEFSWSLFFARGGRWGGSAQSVAAPRPRTPHGTQSRSRCAGDTTLRLRRQWECSARM